MKHFKLFALPFICMIFWPVFGCADDRPIPANQLPAISQQFIAQTFPGKTVAYAEKDTGSYEVSLNDGTKIDFTRKGEWDKVETYTTAVPAAIIPAAIAQYVTANFADQVITKIDKERHGYDVELSNGLDLKFNKAGAFIGYDD